MLAVASALLTRADYASKTSTPGRHWLAETAGVAYSTVGEILRFLKRIGVVGLVAPGRSAEYTPRSSDEYARWGDGGPVADRSVYVLCRVLTEEELSQNKARLDALLASNAKAVDINNHPIPSTKKSNPKSIKAWASPTLEKLFEAGSACVQALTEDRPAVHWPRWRTTDAQDEAEARFNELQAARTLQFELASLRGMRSQTLANVLRPAFVAQYTVNDIIHLLNYKPDGTQWPHDGFTGIRNKAAALQHRLNAWRHGSEFIYSHTQRVWFASEEGRDRAYEAAVSRRDTKA